MRLRSLYEESGSRQWTGSGNVPHIIFTRQFWRLTATFRTGSCDVLSTSKRSLKGCSTFWPHIQVRHWNSYWVRSVTYDRVLSADIYGIRMANKKMIDMRAFLMRCLKLSPRDCTTNGLKLDKCKAWLRHLNASSIKESSNLSPIKRVDHFVVPQFMTTATIKTPPAITLVHDSPPQPSSSNKPVDKWDKKFLVGRLVRDWG